MSLFHVISINLINKKQCENYGIREVEIVEIDYTTDGQATTCSLALPYCDPEESIMVYNIDRSNYMCKNLDEKILSN